MGAGKGGRKMRETIKGTGRAKKKKDGVTKYCQTRRGRKGRDGTGRAVDCALREKSDDQLRKIQSTRTHLEEEPMSTTKHGL